MCEFKLKLQRQCNRALSLSQPNTRNVSNLICLWSRTPAMYMQAHKRILMHLHSCTWVHWILWYVCMSEVNERSATFLHMYTLCVYMCSCRLHYYLLCSSLLSSSLSLLLLLLRRRCHRCRCCCCCRGRGCVCFRLFSFHFVSTNQFTLLHTLMINLKFSIWNFKAPHQTFTQPTDARDWLQLSFVTINRSISFFTISKFSAENVRCRCRFGATVWRLLFVQQEIRYVPFLRIYL